MKKQNKTLFTAFVVFIVVALIAIALISNKGNVFGHSLVATSDEAGGLYIVGDHTLELSCDKEYLSAKDDEEAKLTVLLDGEETTEEVTYTSSNKDVATVKDGVVTAVGVGTATITAKCKDAEDSVEVTGIVPIKTMKFTATSSSIKVGNDLQLKLQVTPSDASIDTLIYSSSDDETAAVNKNGIVTGRQKGKVTITVFDTYTETEKSVNLTIR